MFEKSTDYKIESIEKFLDEINIQKKLKTNQDKCLEILTKFKELKSKYD